MLGLLKPKDYLQTRGSKFQKRSPMRFMEMILQPLAWQAWKDRPDLRLIAVAPEYVRSA